jgi:hypothetical protein
VQVSSGGVLCEPQQYSVRREQTTAAGNAIARLRKYNYLILLQFSSTLFKRKIEPHHAAAVTQMQGTTLKPGR